MKFTNGIIFLDEIDKITNNFDGMEITALLLHILDRSQNYDFHDKYLQGMSIDLSKIWFIVAMNDENKLNPILRDRLHIINIKSYTKTDKTNILQKHFIPQILERFDLVDKIIFTDDICKYIVSKSHIGDSGVRKLKGDIETIVNKIKLYNNVKGGKLRLNFKIDNFSLPFTPTKQNIDDLLNTNEKEQLDQYNHQLMYI